MRAVRTLFWIGLLLVAVSAYPLLLMAREVWTGSYVGFRYRLTPLHNSQTATLGTHRVSLVDDHQISPDASARVRGTVRILIDDREYSVANGVEIRPHFQDANRYHGFLFIVSFTDSFTAESHVAVMQNLGVDPNRPRLPSGGFDFQYLRFRAILLGSDGRVREETFFYKDRGKPPIRAALARFVSSSPMGFHSDLMMVWPTLIYPFLFPWASALVSVVCLVSATILRGRARVSIA
jgi:hypothetical protein